MAVAEFEANRILGHGAQWGAGEPLQACNPVVGSHRGWLLGIPLLRD